MASVRARLARQFESNEEVRAALRDLQDAQRGYDAAVAKANRDLENNPEFKQAEAEKQQAARKIEAIQAADRQAAEREPATRGSTTQPAPISPEVIRAAQQKLNAASHVTALTSDRAQSDPAVTAAREKLESTADRLNTMKDKFDALLQSDSQWQAAKQKLDAARGSAPQ
jgi:chromosome segregation ATPase